MKANRRSRRKSKKRARRSSKRSIRRKNKRGLGASRRRGSGRRSSKRGKRGTSKRSRRGAAKRSRRSSKRSRRSSGKRRGGRRSMRRNGSSQPRDAKGRFTKAKRGKGRGKRKRTRGVITVSHTARRGGKRVTRTKRFKYRAPVGRRGRISVFSPGRPSGSKSARRYDFVANKRRGSSRRTSFRRNGAADSILSALKKGAPVFGGFAAHRILTGLIATNASSALSFIPSEYQVPAVGLAVAAIGAFAAKSAIKGENGDLAAAGMFVSFLQQAVLAALRAAGQTEAASAVGGIPVRGTTAYGAYELVDSAPLNGFGASPYAQALAASPYAQALAATPYGGRGNYLDVPALGAYPQQALAAAYPQQAQAGYGAYEITQEGVTLDGIGTDQQSMERELNMADAAAQHGSVGFGADVVGRSNITIPDGAEAAVTGTPQLPMTVGNFGSNVFGTGFGN